MDLDGAIVSLSVVHWVQTISNNSPTDAPGASIRASCSAQRDFDIALSSGEYLSEIPISLSITPGPLTTGNGQPLERGIGLFSYISTQGVTPPSAIGCYIGLDNDHYDEVWLQVRTGRFTDCKIGLDIAPLPPNIHHPRWQIENNRGSLFVLGASIDFIYRVGGTARP